MTQSVTILGRNEAEAQKIIAEMRQRGGETPQCVLASPSLSGPSALHPLSGPTATCARHRSEAQWNVSRSRAGRACRAGYDSQVRLHPGRLLLARKRPRSRRGARGQARRGAAGLPRAYAGAYHLRRASPVARAATGGGPLLRRRRRESASVKWHTGNGDDPGLHADRRRVGPEAHAPLLQADHPGRVQRTISASRLSRARNHVVRVTR